jgi:murein DD-endopeptidase MepM/ murein hydrolase activator NlpD
MGRVKYIVISAIVLTLAACGGAPERYAGDTRSSTKSPIVKQATRAPAANMPAKVKVRKGDTVYGISRRYGVSPKTIIGLNNLRAPYHLEIGQTLRLPAPRSYIVVKGDTIYGISRKHGVDMSELTRVNKMRSPYTLEIGDKLSLPPQTRAVTRTASSKTSRKPSTSKKPTRKPVAAPPPRSGFAWPVKGRVISGFGPKKGGLHNDGINIAANKGTAVKVTDAGTIVYSGNELPGYGNLLLVRHSGGWVSAYGHLGQVLVKRGDVVKRGQMIAKAGSTGSVTSTQLHFELRKGSAAVDPRKYLPGV